jgi:hypothetical protein
MFLLYVVHHIRLPTHQHQHLLTHRWSITVRIAPEARYRVVVHQSSLEDQVHHFLCQLQASTFGVRGVPPLASGSIRHAVAW